jgi:two-component system copper resistance phosphate regulon response regulator CusR
MRILIIEDEKKTAAYLSKGFAENGFKVDVAGNGEDGLYLAAAGGYDVIILDVALPDRNGFSILAELQEKGDLTPVLFLTASDAVEDRIRGLEGGADDYLVKPFSFSELLLRVRTILRHSQISRQEVLSVADLRIDLLKRKVTRGGKRLDLTAKEFTLLSLFAQRTGEVLSRTIIADRVWDMNFDSDTNVVDVAVRRLREKMDDPYPRKLIRTVRGVGYVLEEN